MESIKIRETNSEILIFLDRNMPTRLSALEEAIRILKVEAIRETIDNQRVSRQFNRNEL